MRLPASHTKKYHVIRIFLFVALAASFLLSEWNLLPFLWLFPSIIIFAVIAIGITFWTKKKDQLTLDQFEFLQKEADFKLMVKRTKFDLFLPTILMAVFVLIFIYPDDSIKAVFYIVFYTILFNYDLFANSNYDVPTKDRRIHRHLYFTNDQIIYQHNYRIVIDKTTIQKAYIDTERSMFVVEELNGKLQISLQSVNKEEVDQLGEELRKFMD